MEKHWLVLFLFVAFRLAMAQDQGKQGKSGVKTVTQATAKVPNQLSQEERLKRADQALNQFLQEVLQNLSVKMKTGMDGQILDPVQLDDMQLQPLVAGEVFDVRMRNISVAGLSDFRVTQLDSQLSESRVKVALHFARLSADCLFAANGTLYEIFRVTGAGNATLYFNEVHARTVLYLSRENGTLRVISADQPYVDFSSAEIFFRESPTSEPIRADSVATQLGPLYFWVLTASAVDAVDYPLGLYLNGCLADFPISDYLEGYALRQRRLRIHVPRPYAYVSSQ